MSGNRNVDGANYTLALRQYEAPSDSDGHFVAFDVEAAKFRFLRDVNGYVVQAADGPQLQAELAKIYEKRILAEAEETEPK